MEKNHNNNKKDKLYDALQLIFVTILFISAAYFTKNVLFKSKLQDAPKIVITTPDDQNNLNLDGTGGLPPIETETIHLLQNEYNPDQVINYDDMIRVALLGEFTVADMHIKGEISNNKANFLTLIFNDINGTIGGFRNSSKTLDPARTTNIYTKETSIDLTINLKENVNLSTTQQEYNQGIGGQKSVNLWDKIKPPVNKGSIVNFYTAPYDENGRYGDGSKITNIEFEYACKENSFCFVKLCPKGTLGTQCLEDFKKGASVEYKKLIQSIK